MRGAGLGLGGLRGHLITGGAHADQGVARLASATSTLCSYWARACSARASAARVWLTSRPPVKSGKETPASAL